MQKLTKIAKSLTSFILATAFLISNLSGIAAFAAENDLTPSSIQIIATSTESDEPRKFDGYWSGSDFYLAAEDYAKITRYSYEEGSNAVRFKLGMKDILIQKGSGTMQILALRYQGKISRIVSMNGQTYLPMSELLPWLNVTVEQDDETAALRITSDSNSLWEYVGDTANYKFNLYQQMQGFTGGTTSLHAIMITDVVSHVRWDAMFKSAIDTDISRYDTTIYQDVFYEYSKELFDPDLGYMLADKTATVWDTAQKINKKLDSVEEMFDIDENAIILKLDDILREQYLTEQFGSAVGFLRQFSELRKAITKLSPVHPFLMAALDTMKKFDAATKTGTEYRDFLGYISTGGAGHSLVGQQNTPFTLGLDDAAQFYQSTRYSVEGLYLEVAVERFGNYMKSHITDIYSSIGDALVAVAQENGADFVPYVSIVKGIGSGFDLLLPDLSKGFSEMRKMPVYADVAETMWRVSQALLQQDMTAENVAYICQSQMMSLILSKKCYSAFRDVNNGKLFFDDTAKNAIQTNQIDPINTLLAEFSLTASCRVNDSVEGKDEAQTNIKTILQSVVETSSDAIEDTPSSSEETAPSEETSAESEVIEEPSKEESVPTAQEIENIYRDFVAQNFSGHYIALKADVTHDGIKDLVVVDYQDIPDWGSDAYTEDGYVYTWQSNGVKLLKHDQDMNIQGGSGLLWYLRKLDNGMYNLIDVDSYIHQGYNSATIRELSLTANGDEILEKPTYKFGEQGQPISDDEYDAFESKWLEVTNGTMELSPFNVEGGSPYRLNGTVIIDSSIILSNKM